VRSTPTPASRDGELVMDVRHLHSTRTYWLLQASADGAAVPAVTGMTVYRAGELYRHAGCRDSRWRTRQSTCQGQSSPVPPGSGSVSSLRKVVRSALEQPGVEKLRVRGRIPVRVSYLTEARGR